MDNIKRVVSGLILFPIVAALLIWGNKYLVDIAVSVIAIMSLHEFYKAFTTSGKAHPIGIIGYIAAILICFMHVIPINLSLKTIGLLLPITLLSLFLYVIATNLKKGITDIAVTFLGICYIVIFLMYIPIIREDLEHGRILIWFLFFASWGTDTFAYFVGKTIRKTSFYKNEPT